MNKPIRSLALVCLLMFLALMVNATVVQFVQADSLNAKNGNRRVIDEEFSRERGAIVVDGEPIAESVPSDGRWEFQRQYPSGPLYSHVTGYFSYTYGRSAIENSQNRVLSGSDDRLFVNRVVDLLASKKPQGGSVELTLDPVAQQTAAASLDELGKNVRGAAVALDPQTGAILAMVSRPTFDPNGLASHRLGEVSEAWQALTGNDAKPLLNRATQQVLPPGSTFKVVTAAAAIKELGLDADSEVKGGAELTFPGISYTLKNAGGGSCGGDPISLERAMQVSCNVSFGDMALEVGQEKLDDMAAKFGFGSDVLQGLATNPSRFATKDADLEAPQLAQSSIGQFEVAASPLQMAMVAAGVANEGVVMEPHLVKTVRAPNLQVLEETAPQQFSRALEADEASVLNRIMVNVVERGTGAAARIPGVEVGGKTGTAQTSKDRPPYAWFIAYAPADNPQVAVAVVVESADIPATDIAGGRVAGPIARSIMEAVLR